MQEGEIVTKYRWRDKALGKINKPNRICLHPLYLYPLKKLRDCPVLYNQCCDGGVIRNHTINLSTIRHEITLKEQRCFAGKGKGYGTKTEVGLIREG